MDAVVNALSVLLIIVISYFLKRIRILNVDTARQLAYVVMYLTLPSAILTSANGIELKVSFLGVMVVSACANIFLLTVGFFSSRNYEKRMFNMLNISCFNIGNFIIPFLQHTMSPEAFLALCMFDVVNALFCFGGAYSVSLYINRKYFPDQKITFKSILKGMSKSVPFYVYALVIVLSSLGITLPKEVLKPFEIIAGANTLLCMMIIGIALSFNITKEQLKQVLKSCTLRYISGIFLAVCLFLFVPFDKEILVTIMVIFMAPMTSVAPIFTMKALPKYAEESADLLTLAYIVSIILVTLMDSLTSILL